MPSARGEDATAELADEGTIWIAGSLTVPFSWIRAPQTALLRSLLAPTLGVSEAEVPDLGVLMVGPMARGAEVSLR